MRELKPMAEKALDFGKFEKFEAYEPLKLKILGQKEVVRKKDNKRYQVLCCQDDEGRQVDLFDWGLIEREGEPYVLKKHLKAALDTAKEGK